MKKIILCVIFLCGLGISIYPLGQPFSPEVTHFSTASDQMTVGMHPLWQPIEAITEIPGSFAKITYENQLLYGINSSTQFCVYNLSDIYPSL